jgi:hypothetical protein
MTGPWRVHARYIGLPAPGTAQISFGVDHAGRSPAWKTGPPAHSKAQGPRRAAGFPASVAVATKRRVYCRPTTAAATVMLLLAAAGLRRSAKALAVVAAWPQIAFLARAAVGRGAGSWYHRPAARTALARSLRMVTMACRTASMALMSSW